MRDKKLINIIESSVKAVQKQFIDDANTLNKNKNVDFCEPLISEADFQAVMLVELRNQLKAKKLHFKYGVTNEFRFSGKKKRSQRRVDTTIYYRSSKSKNNFDYEPKDDGTPCYLYILKIAALIEYKAHWHNSEKKINKDINSDIKKVKDTVYALINSKPQKVEVESTHVIGFNYIPQTKHIKKITENSNAFVYYVSLRH